MLPSLLETLSEANYETFTKNWVYQEKAEKLLYEYIDKHLKAPPNQKKELKELIFSCLRPYKTFVNMQKEAMRVSKKLIPKLIEKRLARKPDLERLN